jgi:hypothetical protein
MKYHMKTHRSDKLYGCEEGVFSHFAALMGFAGIVTGYMNSHIISLYQRKVTDIGGKNGQGIGEVAEEYASSLSDLTRNSPVTA